MVGTSNKSVPESWPLIIYRFTTLKKYATTVQRLLPHPEKTSARSTLDVQATAQQASLFDGPPAPVVLVKQRGRVPMWIWGPPNVM